MATADRPSTPSAAAAPPRPASPGLGYGAMRVFDLSIGQMLWSRRTIFMALVVGVPVVIAVVLRVLVELGAPVMRAGGTPIGGGVVFGLMMWGFFVRFAVPVLAVFYGTSLIADEVEDKTLTYLFTRPVPRAAVLLGKYLAYLMCTIGVVLPSVVLVWLLIAPVNGALGETFINLVKDLGILGAGLAVYGAVFALVGATVKRPLVFGLAFIFGWETLALALPGFLRRLSVAYYLQGLVPHAMPADSPLSLVQSIFRDDLGVTESLVSLTVIALVSLWLAGRAVSRREYVLEQ
ncbi:MAG TPA: ABC transporter permease [Vicinamibacterales bacterium]|jgi:ABC-type transport system involved in multi-copper enzyme maturation permease subunit|nr:ABC transporter permease [Vicinamibacterales bacterium]